MSWRDRRYTLNQLKAVQDWVMERQLRTVPGVIDVTGFGGTVKQYQILLDSQLMRHYDVTLQMVTNAISQSNANVGGDVLPLGDQSHNVRAIGYLGEGVDSLDPAVADQSYKIEVEKLEDIQDVVVTTYQNMPVYIKQIAKVVIGYQPRLGVVGRERENEVVEGIVLMRKYEKSLPVSKAVLEKLKQIEEEHLLPKGMTIQVFNQRTELVNVTTHNVLHNLLVGMGLVITILFVFLGDLASAGIVAIMIPLALLFSIRCFISRASRPTCCRSARSTSASSSTARRSSSRTFTGTSRPTTPTGRGRLIDRIIDASREIEQALFFSTTIIVCAFIPLFSMTGPEGALFGPMASTYAFAICGALLAGGDPGAGALLVPLREQDQRHRHVARQDHEAALPAGPQLRSPPSLRHASCLHGTVRLHVQPDSQAGGRVHAAARGGVPVDQGDLAADRHLQEAARMAPRLREVIGSIPEIRGVMSHVGRPDDGTDVTSYFNLEFNAPLIPMEEWRRKPVTIFGKEVWDRAITREEIQDELMAKFKAFPAHQLQLLAVHPRQR